MLVIYRLLLSFELAGFEIEELVLPIAQESEGNWLDEMKIAPDLVFRCVRTGLGELAERPCRHLRDW
jgi:hypothetical protein